MKSEEFLAAIHKDDHRQGRNKIKVKSQQSEQATSSSAPSHSVLKIGIVGLLLLSGGFLLLNRNRGANSDLCLSENLSLHKGGFDPIPNWVFVSGYHDSKNDVGEEVLSCTEKVAAEFPREKEHFVLVEGVPSGKEVKCSRLKIKEQSNRKCIGWDDADHLAQAGKELLKYHSHLPINMIKSFYDSLIQGRHSGRYVDTQVDTYLDKTIKAYRNAEQELKKEYGIADIQEIASTHESAFEIKLLGIHKSGKKFQEIEKQRSQGIPYEKIFNNNAALLNSPAINHHQKTATEMSANPSEKMLKRNKSLTKTLTKFSGIFAVIQTGDAHTRINNAHSIETEAVEYLHQELEKGRDQNPYAILALSS